MDNCLHDRFIQTSEKCLYWSDEVYQLNLDPTLPSKPLITVVLPPTHYWWEGQGRGVIFGAATARHTFCQKPLLVQYGYGIHEQQESLKQRSECEHHRGNCSSLFMRNIIIPRNIEKAGTTKEFVCDGGCYGTGGEERARGKSRQWFRRRERRLRGGRDE